MGATVLIVDDHATFRRLSRRLLERCGFSVVGEAADGASALAAVAELHPDIVLLDVLLPDTSGFAIADAIDAAAEHPLVVLTSTRRAVDYGVAATGRRFIDKSDLTVARIRAAFAR